MTRDLFWGERRGGAPDDSTGVQAGPVWSRRNRKKHDKNERLIWGRQREREGEGVKLRRTPLLASFLGLEQCPDSR
jgi:hypothetical protein